MYKKIILLFVIFNSIYAQGSELKIALMEAPLLTESKNSSGLGYGIISDIIKNACNYGGLEYSPVFYPLKRAGVKFENDDIPFILGVVGKKPVDSEKSEDNYLYLPCYKVISSFYYYKPNWNRKNRYKEYSDLKDIRIGIPRGLHLKKTFEEAGIIVEEYNNPEFATKMLISGRIELLFQIDFIQINIINNEYKKYKDNFNKLKHIYSKSVLGLIYKSNNKIAAVAADKFHDGLLKIVENGKYMEILKRYYSPEKVPQHHADFLQNLLRK